MKKIIVLLILITLFSCRKDLPPEYFDFGLHYGGDKYDEGHSIAVTEDGGYIICGTTNSFGAGNYDIYLIKTDSQGNELWSRTFGGEKSDIGYSIIVTEDGGYIICGKTDSFGAGKEDVYLIKTDSEGNELWSRTFGGEKSDIGNSVAITEDGGYIISGSTKSYGLGKEDVYLIKTNSDGNELWSRTFGGKKSDIGNSVTVTEDSQYIISGGTKSYGSGRENVYLIKTDSDGNELWSKTFGGELRDYGSSVAVTKEGGYIVCGTSIDDVYLIKTNNDGNQLWDNYFNIEFNSAYGNSIAVTEDGEYIVCGTITVDGLFDVYLIKADSDGNQLWSKTLGGKQSDRGHSIAITEDEEYVICGSSQQNPHTARQVILIKTDSEGELLF